MNFLNTVIETARVTLQPIDLSFASDIERNLTEEVAWYLVFETVKDVKNVSGFIKKARNEMENGEIAHFVVQENKTGKFLGCASLYDIKSGAPEMGVWLIKECWGEGYGFEVFSALKKFAKSIPCEHIVCRVAKQNIPSKRLVEKIGGEMQGIFDILPNFAGKEHIFLIFHIEL